MNRVVDVEEFAFAGLVGETEEDQRQDDGRWPRHEGTTYHFQ